MSEDQHISFLDQLKEWTLVFTVVGFIAIICNIVGYDAGFLESIPGMIIFAGISTIGLSLNYLIPWNIPTVVYISLIGMLVAIPASPISEPVIYWSNKVSLMALCTPILAYAGVVVGRDWKDFTSVGWRGLLISLLVILGTFFVSGGIAEIMGSFS